MRVSRTALMRVSSLNLAYACVKNRAYACVKRANVSMRLTELAPLAGGTCGATVAPAADSWTRSGHISDIFLTHYLSFSYLF